MGILKILYTLPLALLLTGCYEDFTPEINTKPVLCLNSLITAGQPIDVSVTHTWLYTDADGEKNHQVDDATITIYANGSPVGSDYIPSEGDKIKIYADSPTYGHAEGETTVPVSASIGLLKYEPILTSAIDWVHPDETVYDFSMRLSAKLTIDDPSGTDNFYHFSFTGFPEDDESDAGDDQYSRGKFYKGHLDYESDPIFSEHMDQLDEVNGSDTFGFNSFSDRQFQGATYTLNLLFEDIFLSFAVEEGSEITDEMLDCGLVLTLSTVSRSYYNWCIYLWNATTGMMGDLDNFGMCDPMWGYSNVSTGAGVIAARTQKSFTVSLKDFLEKEIFQK